jgi:flagella basal body P-ring formation protein FlgA
MRALRLIALLVTVGADVGLAATLPAALPVATLATAKGTPVPLSREYFVAAVGREIAAHFNLDGDLQLELLRPWAPPARVASAWTITVVEFPSVPSSSMLVRCRAQADGATESDWTLVLRATLWREAWVARLPLASGAIFDPSQLEARRVDLLRERDVVPASVGDRSYIFARGVPAGRLLTWRDIARRPLVKKGNIVEVSAADGLLLVTLKAFAMENGAQGDTVTVRNPESQKTFAAIVVDENRVQVRF